ncbi:MAG: J domain-containing protein, partial [candidate division Zixibacteria bacterium]|nr:J domain-containing protein [candidate division Zixibacteria bacterium]
EEKEHERFIRQGDDIIYQHMISFSAAALGEKIEVPTLRGSEKIKIAPGTQSGKTIKLRGEGIPHLRSYGRGDQIVIITVWTPKKLSAEDKRLLEQLGRSDNFAPPKLSKSLFEKLRSSLGV